MGMTQCSVGGSDGSMVSVVVNGVGLMVPIGICASFAAFANYVAQNSAQTVDTVNDKGSWIDSFGGYGITMA